MMHFSWMQVCPDKPSNGVGRPTQGEVSGGFWCFLGVAKMHAGDYTNLILGLCVYSNWDWALKQVHVCVPFAGNGPSSASGGAAHRDGAGMGGSIYLTDEAHTYHLYDAGMVCQWCEWMLDISTHNAPWWSLYISVLFVACIGESPDRSL